MKLWTYSEASQKVLTDLDLEDETFISPDELVGYFNEAFTEAESEIQSLDTDYFLCKYFVPFVTGVPVYVLPNDILANKVRGFMYQNGSIIYPIVRYRRRFNFQNIAFTDQYGAADDYRYLLTTPVIGQAQIEIHPPARETAILAPKVSQFTPAILWYIRNCVRIPLLGEFCNPELIATTQVNPTTDTIQTYSGTTTIGIVAQGTPGATPGSTAFITGDAVQLQIGPTGTLPAPLVAGTTYYVIAQGSGVVQLATSKANALAGTAIDLTTVGSVYFTLQVAATVTIRNRMLIDIPEHISFLIQWVKCRCMEKEGDPRLENALKVLVGLKKSMVDSLTVSVPDDDDEIQPDFSAYSEMS